MNRVTGRNTRTFKKLPLCAALLVCIYGTSALAQTPPAQTPQQLQQAEQAEQAEQERLRQQEAVELDRVVVTGSLLRRREYTSISPVQVITAESSVEVGMIDTAEFIQSSSIAAGSTQVGEAFSSAVLEGGVGVQTVSLRGLGANRTAVLLNGKRPGAAGTRGSVAAFDLNVIPSSIVQRVEILKDGSSSIYGSDALAGVVNIITRPNVSRPELTVSTRAPFVGGGEYFQVSGVTGWDVGSSGNITVAAEYNKLNKLTYGSRRWARCAEDLVTDQAGNRIDREDRSILAGTPLGDCSSGNLYANTVIDAFTGVRYVPTWDGTTIGLLPGYRPRVSTTYANSPRASYTDVLNFPFTGDRSLIPQNERMSLFASSTLQLGDVGWDTQLLLSRRKTEARGLRQFFPLTGGATAASLRYRYTDDPTFVTPVPSGVAQPVMPFRSDQDVEINYGYISSELSGMFTGTESWSWSASGSYSLSSGDYRTLGIDNTKTGDLGPGRTTAPAVNYYDLSKGYLTGEGMDDLVDALGIWYTGNTKYDQLVFNGVVTGELFQLPAGAVGAAFGLEYRRFSIDDQPSEIEKRNEVWGTSTAQVTKGTEIVKEAFTEIEVPLLKSLPLVESLTLNLSARAFQYDQIDESDVVWKAGLGWQVTPTVLLRSTKGTSFRSPGLYEMFLGNQSSFTSQLALDPCIDWGNSSNQNLRQNCAAAGIPANYAGNPVTATVYQGGAGSDLQPETSRAFTGGIVLTPTFLPISLAVDYFQYEVNNEISQLTAAAIVSGCYGLEVYPNAFCQRLVRNPSDHPSAPNKIEEVYASYINVNKQKVRGYDVLGRFDQEYGFGRLGVEAQFTYMKEDFARTFSATASDGYLTNDRNGSIGRPKLVGNVRSTLKRNDWAYTWSSDYVGRTQRLSPLASQSYFGFANAKFDTVAERRIYHTVSLRYDQPDWSFLIGVRNLLDSKPDTISNGVGFGRFGNVPSSATQYDLYGRTLFVRYNHKF